MKYFFNINRKKGRDKLYILCFNFIKKDCKEKWQLCFWVTIRD